MLKKTVLLLAPDAGGSGGGAPAAPAAPATPTPTPAANAEPAAPAGAEADPFDALDKRITPKSRAADDAAKEKEKSDLRDKAADAPVDDKGKKAEPADKAPVDASRKIESGPKALRDQLEKTNAELKTHRERVQSLETKIQEYESKGKDTTALAERLKTIESEKEALQGQLSVIKKEASPEFIAKHIAPFERLAEKSKKVIQQLKVYEDRKKTDDSTGEVTITKEAVRDAKWEDFTRIFGLPYGEAQEEAERIFGKGERIVMSHYDMLHMKQDERDDAINEQRATWKQQEAKDKADAAIQETNRAKNIEGIQSAWRTVNAELIEKNPELYAATPKDTDEEKLVADAYNLFDAKPKTWQQQVLKDAHIRNKLAGFYLARHKLNKANERVAELEAALSQAKGSKPGRTVRPGGQEAPAEKSWDADLREAMA